MEIAHPSRGIASVRLLTLGGVEKGRGGNSPRLPEAVSSRRPDKTIGDMSFICSCGKSEARGVKIVGEEGPSIRVSVSSKPS